jgi:hypothetical protein
MLRQFKDYLMQLVVVVTVTAATAMYALVKKYWNWPTAVVYSVLLTAGSWYLTDKLGLGISTKSKIRNWLDESGFPVQTIQDTNDLHFVVTDPLGIKTTIIQVKKGGPLGIAAARLIPTSEQKAVYDKMTVAQQYEFWKRPRLELMKYGISFTNLTLGDEGVTLSDQIIVGKDFTGVEFMRRVLFVRSAARMYFEFLTELKETEPITKQ